MAAFEYPSVLISIILVLGMTRVLGGTVSGDLHLDNIPIFDPIGVSDPEIRCDLEDFLGRVTELSVVCVRPEE
ncbi:MAG TPA: hypothetical protein VEU75_04700 [Candidatus Acidoferrum sp.]|nr:hypothetical protein [Candidatus Acidoferrum sp.]